MDLKMINQSSLDLFYSSLLEVSPLSGDTKTILEWREKLCYKIECSIEIIPFKEMHEWFLDNDLNIRHQSGKFFSIEGIQVKTNMGKIKDWCQPIINQPEIGFLGIICKKLNGVLHFLIQAKIEPGNINLVQLSPTLQATKSNYTQVHQGNRPPYLDYFLNFKQHHVIVDQLQSEQGARFLRKRNRNIIIEVMDNFAEDLPNNFIWLTLGQLKKLLCFNNIINMDLRTVLSSLYLPLDNSEINFKIRQGNEIVEGDFKKLAYESLIAKNESYLTIESIISWFTHQKTLTELSIEKCPIKDCLSWKLSESRLHHEQNKYFDVIATKVSILNREVRTWTQPLIRHYQTGIVGLILKKINGILHLLIQAKMEPGNFDLLEMAPTVQCITGSYLNPEYEVPFLHYFTEVNPSNIIYDQFLSEEGGRFYQEQNRYMAIMIRDTELDEIDNNFIWITLFQAKEFIKFNNYFNIELRSLVASISPI